jgi:transitional endoplasmic reticulum ATPase
MELIVCLTTNHVDHIEPAMMRPGRLDAVISVKAPDAVASVNLVKLYARGRLDPQDDFARVGEKLSGQIPAVIREVVERSKLAAVRRLKPNEELALRASDLEYAADEMLNHLRLMTPKPEDTRSKQERAAEVLGKHLVEALVPKAPNGKSAESTRNAHAG